MRAGRLEISRDCDNGGVWRQHIAGGGEQAARFGH
jgi:predicted secreted protein